MWANNQSFFFFAKKKQTLNCVWLSFCLMLLISQSALGQTNSANKTAQPDEEVQPSISQDFQFIPQNNPTFVNKLQQSAQNKLSSQNTANPQPTPERAKKFNRNTRPIKAVMRTATSNTNTNKAAINAKASIVLFLETDLTKPEFTIADIATVESTSKALQQRIDRFVVDKLKLGDADYVLSADDLRKKLQFGFPRIEFLIEGEQTTIRYQAIQISPAEQEHLIREHITQNNPEFAAYEIDFFKPPETLLIPNLKPSYELTVVGPKLPQSMFQNWVLKLYNQNVLFKKVLLRGRLRQPIQQEAQTAQPKTQLATAQSTKQPIKQTTSANFDQFFADQSAEVLPVLPDAPTTADLTQRTTQKENFVFSTSTQKKQYLVDKNTPVELLFQDNGWEIKTQGIALENGNSGDWIRVRNIDSKKIVSAFVISPTQVLVKQ